VSAVCEYMTAAADIIVPIPALLPHQELDVRHPARFKVLRKGRRWGKDRLAFHVAWFGHGPDYSWPGILDGWDVAWLAPDFKQGRGIWHEEIAERFQGIPGVSVNQQDKTVLLDGCGGLFFYTSENVNAIRGLGKRLKGVIINEAAHLDLSAAWYDVILPTLTDNDGWAIIMSTPNAGTDGGLDENENRRVPSYFNTLCEEIQQHQRTEDWMESYGTADENPKIGPERFAKLVAEYPTGSVTLEQEVYAKLLAPGAGLAFPEWLDTAHTLETFDVPDHWELGAGYDWGYWQPSAFVLTATGEEGNTVVLSEKRWVQKDGYDMGYEIGTFAAGLGRPLRGIAADSSISGVAAKRGYPNQQEEIQAGINAAWADAGKAGSGPWVFGVPKSGESRVMRASLLHKYLKVQDDRPPRLRFLKACGNCITTIPKLPPDAKNPEDVDTKSDDHFYDALTYFLLSRPPLVDVPVAPKPKDRHPGLEQRYKKQLQAMGLIPGGEKVQHARYKPKEWRRL